MSFRARLLVLFTVLGVVPVLTDPPLNAWPFVNLEYSPDGKRLLFVSGHDIYVVDVSKLR